MIINNSRQINRQDYSNKLVEIIEHYLNSLKCLQSLEGLHYFVKFKGEFYSKGKLRDKIAQKMSVFDNPNYSLDFLQKIIDKKEKFYEWNVPIFYLHFTENAEEIFENDFNDEIMNYTGGIISVLDELMELSPNKGNKMLDFLKKEIDGKSSQRAYKTLFENLQKIDYINTKKSYGEKIIEKFLRENNISYKTQFDTIHCYNPETRAILPYDFEIPIYKIIIEVQGNQHYKYTPYFHESEEEFHKLQERDQYKKDFAINHGYTFIELDYKSIMNEDYINVLQKIIKEKNKKIYEIEDQER